MSGNFAGSEISLDGKRHRLGGAVTWHRWFSILIYAL